MLSKFMPPISSFSRLANYLLIEKDNKLGNYKDRFGAEIIAHNGIRIDTTEHIAADMNFFRNQRPGKEKAAQHIILTFAHGEKLTNARLKEITEKFLIRTGITNTQYLIAKHTEKRHLHCHCLINLVDFSGKAINESFIGFRGKQVSQELTIEYGLTKAEGKNKKQTNFEALNKAESQKNKIYFEVQEQIPQVKTIEALKDVLAKKNIVLELVRDQKQIKVLGVRFHYEGKYYKGSAVHKMLSYKNILVAIEKDRKVESKLPISLTENTVKEYLRTAIAKAITGAKTVEQLQAALAAQRIEMIFNYKGETQEIKGVTFHFENRSFKGSDLHRSLSYLNIKKAIEQPANERLNEKQISQNPEIQKRKTKAYIENSLANIISATRNFDQASLLLKDKRIELKFERNKQSHKWEIEYLVGSLSFKQAELNKNCSYETINLRFEENRKVAFETAKEQSILLMTDQWGKETKYNLFEELKDEISQQIFKAFTQTKSYDEFERKLFSGGIRLLKEVTRENKRNLTFEKYGVSVSAMLIHPSLTENSIRAFIEGKTDPGEKLNETKGKKVYSVQQFIEKEKLINSIIHAARDIPHAEFFVNILKKNGVDIMKSNVSADNKTHFVSKQARVSDQEITRRVNTNFFPLSSSLTQILFAVKSAGVLNKITQEDLSHDENNYQQHI